MRQTSIEGPYNEEWEKRRGFPLTAADGNFIQMPQDKELAEYYSGLGQEGNTAPALVSLLYDAENGIVADARIAPVHDSGHPLALEHIKALPGLESFERERMLVLFGRGYPPFEFIKPLQDKEICYVMRAQKNFIRERELKRKRDCRVPLGNSGLRVRAARCSARNTPYPRCAKALA
jgi:hypothetical protein